MNARRARFTTTDVNRGDRRNQKIVNGSATYAVRTTRAGMMGGITSPARPWFRLAVQDPKLAEAQAVKEWLHTVAERMSNVFLKSNLYQTLPLIYNDMVLFATAAMLIEEDLDNVVRFYTFPIGTYAISSNDKGKIDVFQRDFRLTVRQVVEKFCVRKGDSYDFSNVSSHVREAYDAGRLEEWVDICHHIMPNPEFDERKATSKFKRFMSCYYETGGSSENKKGYLNGSEEDQFLSEKGYDYFPVLCPRWEVAAEDSYGTTCPGMDALGDIKALQLMEKRKAQAVEKMINPPMNAPSSMRNTGGSILPGDVNFVDETAGSGFRPSHEVRISTAELRVDIQDTERRISRAFYEDLFLMLANDDRSGITATEISERKEEKLLALGPVLEQLNQDLLDPLIDITFMIMLRQSQGLEGEILEGALIPPIPQELGNTEIKIEYISVMAQAQKLIGIGAMERTLTIAGQVFALNPEATDKFNADQFLDVYSELVSLAPTIIRSDDEVAAMRQRRAEAQQAQAQAESMAQMATAAKDLSQTSLDGNSALNAVLEQANAGALV